MNTAHLEVARLLLADAARLHRWSKHTSPGADAEAAPGRAMLAQVKARAAFALLGAPRVSPVEIRERVDGTLEFPTVGSERGRNFQGLEK